MNQRWQATRARRVLAALQRIGWTIKRTTGSHRPVVDGEQPGVLVSLPGARLGRTRSGSVQDFLYDLWMTIDHSQKQTSCPFRPAASLLPVSY
jgi:predicted RNA binding protein YcfA (HicA-like mRNA interferase family)